jgi:hypothetical protein
MSKGVLALILIVCLVALALAQKDFKKTAAKKASTPTKTVSPHGQKAKEYMVACRAKKAWTMIYRVNNVKPCGAKTTQKMPVLTEKGKVYRCCMPKGGLKNNEKKKAAGAKPAAKPGAKKTSYQKQCSDKGGILVANRLCSAGKLRLMGSSSEAGKPFVCCKKATPAQLASRLAFNKKCSQRTELIRINSCQAYETRALLKGTLAWGLDKWVCCFRSRFDAIHKKVRGKLGSSNLHMFKVACEAASGEVKSITRPAAEIVERGRAAKCGNSDRIVVTIKGEEGVKKPIRTSLIVQGGANAKTKTGYYCCGKDS